MNGNTFQLRLADEVRADVAVDGPADCVPAPWLQALHQHGLRVVAPVGGQLDQSEAAAWLQGCSGLLRPPGSATSALSLAAQSDKLPLLDLPASGMQTSDMQTSDMQPSGAVQAFIDAVLRRPHPRRAYAFFVGRLERDFDHARDALRLAVQSAAGVELLWSDDERHTTNVTGIRERTQWLLHHARFVIADLSLGIESPRTENPSRAHEIGMALAYERPLLLCSQEPRRYPYFSVADLQMSFWLDERELAAIVQRWLWPRRRQLARRVLAPDPTASVPAFEYDASQRFIGPNLKAAQPGALV